MLLDAGKSSKLQNILLQQWPQWITTAPNLTQVTVDHLARQLHENEGCDRERDKTHTWAEWYLDSHHGVGLSMSHLHHVSTRAVAEITDPLQLTHLRHHLLHPTHTPANHYYSAAATLLRSCWVLSSWHYSAATNRQLTVSALNFCRGMRTHSVTYATTWCLSINIKVKLHSWSKDRRR